MCSHNYRFQGVQCPYGDKCCWGHVCPNGPKCFHLSKGKCWFKGGSCQFWPCRWFDNLKMPPNRSNASGDVASGVSDAPTCSFSARMCNMYIFMTGSQSPSTLSKTLVGWTFIWDLNLLYILFARCCYCYCNKLRTFPCLSSHLGWMFLVPKLIEVGTCLTFLEGSA